MTMRTYFPKETASEEPEGASAELARLVGALEHELKERGSVGFGAALELMGWLGLGRREFAARLGITPRALARFARRGALGPAASDRLYRLARLVEAATRLHHGDRARAVAWLGARTGGSAAAGRWRWWPPSPATSGPWT